MEDSILTRIVASIMGGVLLALDGVTINETQSVAREEKVLEAELHKQTETLQSILELIRARPGTDQTKPDNQDQSSSYA